VQLHHAGMRSPAELIGHSPVAPFEDHETGARALTTSEVEQVVDDFARAAERSQHAGFDGVEIHGAHGYLLCQFLDAERNVRADRYGGSAENRSRIIFEIVDEVRSRCGEDFQLGVRLSPERFGVATSDIIDLYTRLATARVVDYIDLSLWDTFKDAIDPSFEGQSLLGLFTAIDRGPVRLVTAGRIHSGADVRRALELGVDVVALGRAAITNHDFPRQMALDPDFSMRELPVDADVLRSEGLGERLIDYMRGWKGFVTD